MFFLFENRLYSTVLQANKPTKTVRVKWFLKTTKSTFQSSLCLLRFWTFKCLDCFLANKKTPTSASLYSAIDFIGNSVLREIYGNLGLDRRKRDEKVLNQKLTFYRL